MHVEALELINVLTRCKILLLLQPTHFNQILVLVPDEKISKSQIPLLERNLHVPGTFISLFWEPLIEHLLFDGSSVALGTKQ